MSRPVSLEGGSTIQVIRIRPEILRCRGESFRWWRERFASQHRFRPDTPTYVGDRTVPSSRGRSVIDLTAVIDPGSPSRPIIGWTNSIVFELETIRGQLGDKLFRSPLTAGNEAGSAFPESTGEVIADRLEQVLCRAAVSRRDEDVDGHSRDQGQAIRQQAGFTLEEHDLRTVVGNP